MSVAGPREVPWEYSMALSIAFSPDGKSLAIGSEQKLATVCDAATLKVRHVLNEHALLRINDLAFSPDGLTLATANGDYHAQNLPGEVWLWDVETENIIARLCGHKGHVWSVAFTPDGRSVISSSADGTVKVWDAGTGEEKSSLDGHQGPVRRVVISPDGKLLASGGFDGTIRVYDLATRTLKRSFPAHDQGVNALAFSPDGKTLASSGRFLGGGGVAASLWDVAAILGADRANELRPRHALTGFRGRVLTLAFSPDGRFLAAGGGAYGLFGELKLLDPADGRVLWERQARKSIDSLGFSPDGTTLATAAGVEQQNGDAFLWKVTVTTPE